jgi:hypothetical protein
MEPSCLPRPEAKNPLLRTCASTVSILAFLVAAAGIIAVNSWAWTGFLSRHINLVQRIPVEAVVLTHRLDEQETGGRLIFPRVRYRYEFKGQAFESGVIRHRDFTSENEVGGELHFGGSEGHRLGQQWLSRYPIGQKVQAWIDPDRPTDAMLIRQEISFLPFLLPFHAGLMVPVLWVFVAGVLATWTGCPNGRVVAFCWAALTLASIGPLFLLYQHYADPLQSASLIRLQNAGLGLAGTVLIASLLPRIFRAGLAIGLILSFTLVGGFGTMYAIAMAKGQQFLGWDVDPNAIFARFMDYSLRSGIVMGLLFGIGGWLGAVTLSDSQGEIVSGQQ